MVQRPLDCRLVLVKYQTYPGATECGIRVSAMLDQDAASAVCMAIRATSGFSSGPFRRLEYQKSRSSKYSSEQRNNKRLLGNPFCQKVSKFSSFPCVLVNSQVCSPARKSCYSVPRFIFLDISVDHSFLVSRVFLSLWILDG
jgi:hypothetical protein